LIRLACPECKKDSYSASVETLRPCPYCGFCFSGKYGAEKRDAYSAQKEIPVTFSYKGQNLQARTVNFSENGLSVNCQYIVDKKSCQYIVDNGIF